eukprot:2367723-Lingulodinium_polyedra.AAC.1
MRRSSASWPRPRGALRAWSPQGPLLLRGAPRGRARARPREPRPFARRHIGSGHEAGHGRQPWR